MKTYFCQMKLKTGEWVEILYNSASRRGTFPHWHDLYISASDKVDADFSKIDTTLDSFVLNEKNKHEQCFDDYRIIDCR